MIVSLDIFKKNLKDYMEINMNISFYDNEIDEGLLKLKEKNSSIKHTNSEYDETIINTSIPGREIVDMVTNAIQYNKSGIRMLFYGLSGAGKTALAKYIAKNIRKPLIKKNASDIFNQYLGNSEKNIAEAFKEAKEKNAVLLFDEVDSFIHSRENNSASWELSTVNEFLTQLDDYKGIVICTTNLKNILDKATLRRFHICVEFKALKKEGTETLLKNYFPEYTFTAEQKEKLFHLDTITPGDFGVLSERLQFVNQKNHNATYITEQLCHLQEEKGDGSKAIGFGF